MASLLARLLPLAGLVAAVAAGAQPQISVAVEAGLDGHGALGDVRAWQDAEQEALRDRGLPAQVIQAFPTHPSVTAAVAVGGLGPGGRGAVGLTAGYGSTGGRLAYADYSGTLDVDRVAERTFVGVRLDGTAVAAGPAEVALSVEVRYNRSTLSYRRAVVLVDGRVAESVAYEAEAAPLSVVGAAQAEVAVAGPLRVRVRVGAEGSATDGLDGPDGVEGPPTGVGLGWSGVRGSVGVGVRL